MNISNQSISKKIHHLLEHIEANNHEHISAELQLAIEKNGMEHFPSLSMLECHVIAYIGDKSITNAVSIAKHLDITRGGISKINQRLIHRGLIESHVPEGNKRERFYQLTVTGRKVYQIHRSLHEKSELSLLAMINNYNDAEKEILQKFLEDLMNTI